MRVFKLTEKVCSAECLEISIEGELDLATAEQLRRVLEQAVGSGFLYVVVDLERCEFLDATALSAIVEGRRRLASFGQELLVYGAGGQAERLLSLTEALESRSVLGRSEEVTGPRRNGSGRRVGAHAA
jgi:anti-anti-sigma factor